MTDNLLPLIAQDLVIRRRGRAILGPINLTLPKDGFTILIGPNGSGKTSLLKALHGVARLSEGAVQWNTDTETARHRQAYVFQSPIMLRRSVRENLAYPLRLDRVSKPEIERACRQWAERIGLAEAMDRPAPRLSGGEKQKLALARALIRKPEMLFLDEPCANLDGRATREIEGLLQDAHQSGTRILMATHDLGQLKRLASDVIFLRKGHIHETGTARDILNSPQTPELRAFLQGDIVE